MKIQGPCFDLSTAELKSEFGTTNLYKQCGF